MDAPLRFDAFDPRTYRILVLGLGVRSACSRIALSTGTTRSQRLLFECQTPRACVRCDGSFGSAEPVVECADRRQDRDPRRCRCSRRFYRLDDGTTAWNFALLTRARVRSVGFTLRIPICTFSGSSVGAHRLLKIMSERRGRSTGRPATPGSAVKPRSEHLSCAFGETWR